MTRPRRYGWVLAIAVVEGCYEEPDTMLDTEGTDGTAGDATAGDDDAPEPTATPTDGDDDGVDGPIDSSAGDEPATDDAPPVLCGNGRVDAGETCDDGVNDGRYGGCMPDCSAFADYCGDGEVQAPEACDEGDANANASGCNVDCVVSGSVVATFEVGGLSFCDGDFLTEPAFRDDGNALVAATGYCQTDSRVLVEVTPTGELAQMYEPLLPETPVREGVLLGDNWLLASSGCNYVLAPDGALTEICDPARTVGAEALRAIDDSSYLALDYDFAARYGEASPALGDAPEWSIAPPDGGIVDYGFYDLANGPSGSTLIVGYRNINGSPPSYNAFIGQYTAAGNEAATNWFSEVERFDGIAVGGEGSIYVYTEYPNFVVGKLTDQLAIEWSLPVATDSSIQIAADSTGDVVYYYREAVSGTPRLIKRDPTGTIERWAIDLPHGSYSTRIAIDATDAIWVAAIRYEMDAIVSLDRISP